MRACLLFIFLFTFVTACDNDNDNDNDGSLDSEDCADYNPAIHPGANEICDGLDNDCDGEIDDDVCGDDDDATEPPDDDDVSDDDDTTPEEELDCSNPTTLQCGETGGSTIAAANNINDWQGCANFGPGYTGGESVFRLDSSITGFITVDLDWNDEGQDLDLFVLNSCEGADECAGSSTEETPNHEDLFLQVLGPLYIVVDGWKNSTSSFTITVSGGSCDNDGDGEPDTTDCNDNDASIFHGAPEICDGLDNDCDNTTDDGLLVTYHRDNDGDGYGNSTDQTSACTATGNYTALQGGDCNDNNASIHPGAPEICNNGVDENCVGGDTPCAPVDNDGDGYSTATDCSDGDATIHPGAPECTNSIDNDCDGLTDIYEGCPFVVIEFMNDDCNTGCPSNCSAYSGTGSLESWNEEIEIFGPSVYSDCYNLDFPNQAAQINIIPDGGIVCTSSTDVRLLIYKGPNCTGTMTFQNVSCTATYGWNLNCEDSDGDGYGDFDDQVESFKVVVF